MSGGKRRGAACAMPGENCIFREPGSPAGPPAAGRGTAEKYLFLNRNREILESEMLFL